MSGVECHKEVIYKECLGNVMRILRKNGRDRRLNFLFGKNSKTLNILSNE